MPAFRIDSSLPEHFRQALDETSTLRQKWPTDHDGHPWAEAAKSMAAGPADLDFAGNQAGFEQYLDETMFPALMLCRLARSMRDVKLLGGSERQEVGKMSEPGHFAHSEHLLHVGVKVAYTTGMAVRVVRTEGTKTPDLEVAQEKYVVECTARTARSPRAPLKSDFEHASEKFTPYLGRADKTGWLGVLATDLGLVGSPEVPNIGRPLPTIADLTTDIDANYTVHKNVGVALLTAVGFRIVNDGSSKRFLSAADLSAWRARPRQAVPGSIRQTFFDLGDHISRPAIRTKSEADAE